MGERRPTEPAPTAMPGPKPDEKRAYRKPEVRTERSTERVVLAASSGCGTAIDEETGCDFAV
jgi:hypothetical protein